MKSKVLALFFALLLFVMPTMQILALENPGEEVAIDLALGESTPEPSEEPSAEPTEEPTEEPTSEPTEEPTSEPTEEPTSIPTEEPTPEPTEEQSSIPTEEPTSEPTEGPTSEPTNEPTIDTTKNATFSQAFVLGWVEIEQDAPLLENPGDASFASLSGGVGYALSRQNAGEADDCLLVAFAADDATQSAYIPAQNLRPMHEDEISAYLSLCLHSANTLTYNDDPALPLLPLELLPMYTELMTSQAEMMLLAAPGIYNVGDIAVINNIIANNGLKWMPAPADGSFVPADWDQASVTWSSAATNKRITALVIHSQELSGTLDVSNCTELTKLDCRFNHLSALNVSNCTVLKNLSFEDNRLSTLDISNCIVLETLNCGWNTLRTLNVSNNTALSYLNCVVNNLSELNVSNNTALRWLYCGVNKLSKLDVTNNTALRDLDFSSNNLTAIDLSRNMFLYSIGCDNNRLTELDLSACKYLDRYFYGIGNNPYTHLKLIDGYELNITVAPAQGGTVIFGTYYHGDKDATLTATPYYGYTFHSWTFSGISPTPTDTNSTVTFKLPAHSVTATANFVPNGDLQSPIVQFVTRLYVNVLGRAPDPQGLDFYLSALSAKTTTGAEVVAGFFKSPEFTNAGYSDERFIDILYETCMGRTADAAGKAFWMEHLQESCSRIGVLNSFLQSTEFGNICAGYGITRGSINMPDAADHNLQVTRFIHRLYSLLLNRNPEADGLTFYANQLLYEGYAGKTVAKNFVYSPEFQNRGLSDEEFIKCLYRALLGREADASGLTFQVNELRTKGRMGMLDNFADSPEFRKIMSSYGVK